MKRTVVSGIAILALVAASCSSSDPAASDEYQALEQELAAAEQQIADTNQELIEATGERDALAAEMAASAESAEMAVPPEIADVVDGYTAALNTYDAEAMRSYVTDGFVFHSYGVTNDLDEYTALVADDYASGHFTVRVTGDLRGSGADPTFVVSQPGRVTWDGSSGLYGFSIMTLIQSLDGTWLISENQWTGAPTSHQ